MVHLSFLYFAMKILLKVIWGSYYDWGSERKGDVTRGYAALANSFKRFINLSSKLDGNHYIRTKMILEIPVYYLQLSSAREGLERTFSQNHLNVKLNHERLLITITVVLDYNSWKFLNSNFTYTLCVSELLYIMQLVSYPFLLTNTKHNTCNNIWKRHL